MSTFLFLNLGMPEIMVISLIGFLPLVLMIFCVVDITRSTFNDSTNKVIWVLVVLLAPVLGGLLYLLFGRNQKQLRNQ